MKVMSVKRDHAVGSEVKRKRYSIEMEWNTHAFPPVDFRAVCLVRAIVVCWCIRRGSE